MIAAEPKERSFGLASVFRIRELNVLLALLIVGALISLATPYFLAVDNLMGVFRSFSLTAIMAIGMVMVIVTGGIDLSVGSVLGLSSLMTAFAFLHGFSMPIAIASGLFRTRCWRL
jgi:ribose transport system permease protein